jgi:hypothetical protein
MSSTHGGDISFQSGACNSIFAQTGTAFVQTFVGDSFLVEGELDLSANNTLAGTASVDPSSGFFIDSQTAGAGYTTASGASYVSSTPEPSAILLFTTGLLALVFVMRQKG